MSAAYPNSFTFKSSWSPEDWSKLFQELRPFVDRLMHSYAAPAWQGQEEDIAEDIVQETMVRVYRYVQKDGFKEDHSQTSLVRMAHVIARNYMRDLWRRDKRLIPGLDLLDSAEADLSISSCEEVLDDLTTQSVLGEIARLIVEFPERQRTALMIDLARYNDFGEDPTMLEQAFTRVGINLRAYRDALPQAPVERSRHNASLSYAYKRLRLTYQAEYADIIA